MPDGRCVQFTLKNDEFTDDDFQRPQFKRGLDLMASSTANPPTYKDKGNYTHSALDTHNQMSTKFVPSK
jgi:hypothetical protein